MEDLVADPGQTCEEQQRDDVRVDQRVQQPREEPGMHLFDVRAGEVEDVALRDRLVAVEILQERRQARRDAVDHVLLQRLVRSQVRCLDHGLARERGIAAVMLQ